MDHSAIFDLSYGLYVISAKENNKINGCIVNTVFQLTAEPVTVAVSVNYKNLTYEMINNTKEFTVSIISESFEPGLIGLFGFKSGKDTNKFESVKYSTAKNDIPYLTEGICSYLSCRVKNVVDMGTHALFIAEVIDAEKLADLAPMTYEYYHKVVKGSAPATAPTYREETKTDSSSVQYKCEVCGYIHDGDINELPDDWKCPICKQGKEVFIKI